MSDNVFRLSNPSGVFMGLIDSLLQSISWKPWYANFLRLMWLVLPFFFLSFSNWSHTTFYVWPRFQNFPLQLLLLWACLRNFTNNVNTHSKCSFWRYWSSLICRSFGRHSYMKILQLCHVTWSLEPYHYDTLLSFARIFTAGHKLLCSILRTKSWIQL